MKAARLSPELTALIHHVELNESGWWKKAFGQLVQAVLWESLQPQSLEGIRESIENALGVKVSLDVLEGQLRTLSGQGAVQALANNTYKLTEKRRQELATAHEQTVQQRTLCRATFIEECLRNCPGLDADEVWHAFTGGLSNAVRVAGANFYNLLAGAKLEKEEDWVAPVFAKFPSDHHEGLNKTFAAFFEPKNHPCRAEVLRMMSAYFFAEASQLSPQTLRTIEAGKAKKQLKVVLDTNFIFSLLQLHDNPANDAVLSLLSLAKGGSKHLDLKLQVLPSTLEEAQDTLAAMQAQVEHFRITAAMARAAVDQPMASVVKKFLDAAARAPGLSAEAYFKPYVSELRAVLLSKGISVLEAHPGVYNTRQDVIDDVTEQTRREEVEYPERKRKGYETWLHDVVLWHAVRDRRGDTDSPFDAEYWVVSIDWRFLGFDRYKRTQKATPLPVVLYPTSLVQLAQFWVPRSEALEASIVNSLSLPMFSQGFDAEDERVTLKVLGALSRFENLDDLDEEAIRAIMTNRALRARLKEGVDSTDAQVELVREEVLALHRQAVQQLREKDNALANATSELQRERSRRLEREWQLHSNEERLKELEKVSAGATEAVRSKEVQVSALEDENRRLVATLARGTFVLKYLALPIAAGLGLAAAWHFGAGRFGLTLNPLAHWLLVVCFLVLPIALSAACASHSVPNDPILKSWPLANRFAWIGRKAVIAPAALALSGIFQGGVWDWVKSLFP